MKKAVVAILDIGKTNKKAFLLDENYCIVHEISAVLPETQDEDGDACEDLTFLNSWVYEAFKILASLSQFEIKALNFSTYGASFVFVDSSNQTVGYLYNYLKKYPEQLKTQFYNKYGNEAKISLETASPILGNLNSGMQLYRIKNEQPVFFQRIKFCLHLPQYLSFLFTNRAFSDLTSIGCHTQLWNFQKHTYHSWLTDEGILDKLAPIQSDLAIKTPLISPLKSFCSDEIFVGTGLHDSSAALIPYLKICQEPFILLSTGTWNISLNAFNTSSLTLEELNNDCLCFLQPNGQQVKASRLFAGNFHEIQTKRIAEFFGISPDFYKNIVFDEVIFENQKSKDFINKTANGKFAFNDRLLNIFNNFVEAYYQLMLDLIATQVWSTNLVIAKSSVKKIFVDGGFSKNNLFMNMLAIEYPRFEIMASSVAQASGIGAAMAIHECWNSKEIPKDLLKLKNFSA